MIHTLLEPIKNKIAESGLITIDLKDYYPQGKRVQYDLKQNLFQEMVLKEKEYRDFIKKHDWGAYTDQYVSLHCSVEAIIPSWAFLLLTTALNPYAKKVVYGSLEDLEVQIYNDIISEIDFTSYQNKRVIIKGCTDVFIPNQAYVNFVNKLLPHAKSVMFGEACSTVPLYKRKN